MLQEEVTCVVAWMARQLSDIMKRIAAIITPRLVGVLQLQWKGRQVIRVARTRVIYVSRVVDDRGVRTNQHQMVWCRWTGHLSEVVIAERVFSRVIEICGYIGLRILQMEPGIAGPAHPCPRIVRRIEGRW